MPFDKPVRRVAVVGAGVIGASWAALYLAKGFDVVVTDPATEAEPHLRAYVEGAWPTLKALGLAPGADPARLSFVHKLAQAVQNADFVQENGPERADIKIKLFAQIDEAAPDDTLIASSSASLKMSVIQAECRHPERCLIGQPVNPPHLIPLVEVVGGRKTSPEALDQAMAFYASIGKKPIRLHKEIEGHVAGRLQAALYREILYLIQQGVLSVADADAAVTWGPGLRWGVMGPNLLWHIGGGGIQHFVDHLIDPLHDQMRALGAPLITAELKRKIVEGVREEAAGRTIDELAKEEQERLLPLIRAGGSREQGPGAAQPPGW